MNEFVICLWVNQNALESLSVLRKFWMESNNIVLFWMHRKKHWGDLFFQIRAVRYPFYSYNVIHWYSTSDVSRFTCCDLISGQENWVTEGKVSPKDYTLCETLVPNDRKITSFQILLLLKILTVSYFLILLGSEELSHEVLCEVLSQTVSELV